MQPDDKLLNESEVCSALQVGPETLKKLIDMGLFPDSFCITERNRAWYASDVELYLQLRRRIGAKFPRIGPEQK